MKKVFSTLLAALALLGMFALFVAAQEDEPTWQEQHWTLFWNAVGDRCWNQIYHLVLGDLNQDGVQELVVLHPHQDALVLIVAMDNGTARAFDLQGQREPTLPVFSHVWVDSARGELRLFEFRTRNNAHIYHEVLLCWQTYTATAQRVHGVRFSYDFNSNPTLRVGLRRLNHLRRLRFNFEIDYGVPIVAMSYDVTRAAFFEALDILAPDGTLYVHGQPLLFAELYSNATPATEFMQTSSFWAWWYRSLLRRIWWLPLFSAVFIVLGAFIQHQRNRKRQEKEEHP